MSCVSIPLYAPQFTHVTPLPEAWRDSVYTVSVVYPEYADMRATDVANYKRIESELPDAEPRVETHVTYDRKRASLLTTVNPVVYRDGRYKQLVSFMCAARHVQGRVHRKAALSAGVVRADAQVNVWDTLPAAKRYAKQSVLREGRWAKISVAESGIHQLTSALVRQAGFTDINKVKIYGYGGNLINETLEAKDSWSRTTEGSATCEVDGKRLFYARGPVSWETETAERRTRNYYSNLWLLLPHRGHIV